MVGNGIGSSTLPEGPILLTVKIAVMAEETMEFQGQRFTLNQAEEDLWEFVRESKPGEYTRYYDKLVFNTGRGFVAAYANDLNNYWNI